MLITQYVNLVVVEMSVSIKTDLLTEYFSRVTRVYYDVSASPRALSNYRFSLLGFTQRVCGQTWALSS